MREAVLRVPQRRQRFVRLLDISSDLGIVSDLFNGNHWPRSFPRFPLFLLWTGSRVLIRLLDQHALLQHTAVRAVKLPDRPDHRRAVFDPGRFIARMHGQLR